MRNSSREPPMMKDPHQEEHFLQKRCQILLLLLLAKRLGIDTLRDATMEQLDEIKSDITAEDYFRAKFVIEEKQRVLDVCDALNAGDYETVGKKMYETHAGLSKDYEVSCEELDFLNDVAKTLGVTGSRIMGGGFGGCTINLVKKATFSILPSLSGTRTSTMPAPMVESTTDAPCALVSSYHVISPLGEGNFLLVIFMITPRFYVRRQKSRHHRSSAHDHISR